MLISNVFQDAVLERIQSAALEHRQRSSPLKRSMFNYVLYTTTTHFISLIIFIWLIVFHHCFSLVARESYEQGLFYLQFIQEQYPELLCHAAECPTTNTTQETNSYFYEGYGLCSTEWLRSIKIGGDLKKEFPSIETMRIVEIVKDEQKKHLYGSLIQKITKCAWYQSILPSQDFTSLSLTASDLLLFPYLEKDDLNTSNIKNFLLNAHNAYLLGFFPYEPSIPIDNLLCHLQSMQRKGFITQENIRGSSQVFLFVWKTHTTPRPSTLHKIPRLTHPTQSALTYSLNEGRIGDCLIAYFHAKWLAMEYGLPFLYKTFLDIDKFCLTNIDQCVEDFSFSNAMTLTKKEELAHIPPGTLVTVPFFPDSPAEYLTGPFPIRYFPITWEDPLFQAEVRKSLAPKASYTLWNKSKDTLNVAVHVRKGGSWDNYDFFSHVLPLKFPPESYYVSQIKRIARIFPNRLLVIYLFTDDLNPSVIAERFAKAIQNQNITFIPHITNQDVGKFEDFYNMGQFDCLIRPTSHFSLMAEQLGEPVMTIIPTHCHYEQVGLIVDAVELRFRPFPSI